MIWVEFYNKIPGALRKYPSLRVITLNRKEDLYHQSVCKNEGIRQSTGDLIVLPDADVIVEPTFLETIWKEHEKCEELVMYLQRWDEPQSKHTGEVTIKHLKQVCCLRNPTNYGGCLTVRKKWLMEVNGYEEDPIFNGFTACDLELHTRFKNLGLHVKWHPPERIYHPWHPYTPVHVRVCGYGLQVKVAKARARSLTHLPVKGLFPERNQKFNSIYEEFPELKEEFPELKKDEKAPKSKRLRPIMRFIRAAEILIRGK